MEHTTECKQIRDGIIGSMTPDQRRVKLACPNASHDTLRAWYKGQDVSFTYNYYDFERGEIVYKNPLS